MQLTRKELGKSNDRKSLFMLHQTTLQLHPIEGLGDYILAAVFRRAMPPTRIMRM